MGGGPSPEAAPAAASAPAQPMGPTALGSDTFQYDPILDNKMKSPGTAQGLFGMKIIEVERLLRQYGARPYSYAFGKYSRMSFSVYLLTLMFDKNRKLGGVVVSPKAPFSQVEPQAQQFLIRLFLQNADLKQFTTVIGPNHVEIWFEDNQRFGKTLLQTMDKKERFLR